MGGGGKDADDGESCNCTSASCGHDRDRGRERDADEDVSRRRRTRSVGAAGFSTTDWIDGAGFSSSREHGTAAAADPLSMPVFTTICTVESCSQGVAARGTGHSLAGTDIDIDSETDMEEEERARHNSGAAHVRPSRSATCTATGELGRVVVVVVDTPLRRARRPSDHAREARLRNPLCG